MDLGLKDKVAVITGGSVGIGLAVAEGLAAEGAHIVIAARRPERVEARRRAIANVRRPRARRGLRRRHGRGLRSADRRGRDGSAAPTSSSTTPAPAQRDDHGGAGREVAGLLGSARDGRGAAGARARAADEGARRRRHPAQRLDLRRPAALVRADLQRDQGGADDVLEDAVDRGHRRQHPRQLRQPRPDPDARLGQDRKAAHRRQGRRLAGLSRRRRRRARADQALRHAEELANFFVFLCSDRASYSVGSTYFVDGGMLRTI